VNIYPDLQGLSYPVTRRPIFKNLKHETVTGRVVTATYMQYPLYEFDLSYDYLSAADRESLIGFFLAQGGDLTPFYFDAGPGDDAVTKQSIGSGDGAAKTFNLLRGLGNFSEPIPASFGSPIVYTSGYGGDGVENLFTYSQQFTNAAWIRSLNSASTALTVTDNVTAAPDGTTTAASLIPDTSNDYHRLGRAINGALAANTTGRVQYYVKANGYTRVQIWAWSGGDTTTQFFDLSAVTASGSLNPTITPDPGGNGWYLISCDVGPFTSPSSTIIRPIPSSVASSSQAAYAGDGTSGIYVWGGSLGRYGNQGYIATTASPYTWSVPANGKQVTFAVAPPNNAALSWSGNYYYQCRFLQGSQQYDEFVNLLYNAKAVMLRTYR